MVGKPARSARAEETRETILAVAERMFAERGVFAVSNRQISEAAGQGNNTAVGYHFGTKTDLLRTIVRKHGARVEELRADMLARIGDSGEARDWIACLVAPGARHLAELGSPTWYARFGAQLMTDPVLRKLAVDASSGPTIQRALDGLNSCLPDLPMVVRIERGHMARHLVMHMLAERERALADDTPTTGTSWDGYTTGLIDAITGIWLAPVTADPSA